MCSHWILIIVEYAWRHATILLHTPCALSYIRKFWKWELECAVQFILFGFSGCDVSMRAEILLFFLVLKIFIWKSFLHLKEKFWPCSSFLNHGYGDFFNSCQSYVHYQALTSNVQFKRKYLSLENWWKAK
jgi:hypothetical protein